jgi:Icc-related predicted phosphoesterase
MKFVNSAKFYKANVLIMGGDITGKVVVPIVKQPDNSFSANFLGIDRKTKDEKELEELEKTIRFSGYYPYRTTKEEMAQIGNDEKKIDALFQKLMVENLDRWLSIAEERLKGVKVKCYITPGNDDSFLIDQCFKGYDYIIDPEDQVVQIDEHHEMIGMGYSNITPFKAPRELPEDKLYEKIEAMASKVQKMQNCIFDFHCPPINSELDTCQELDETLRPVFRSGQPSMIGAGSTSVREAIEKHQPLLGLHGHIHECKSSAKIGRTLCLNPGSQYSEGILNGVIINIDEKSIKSHQFTSG